MARRPAQRFRGLGPRLAALGVALALVAGCGESPARGQDPGLSEGAAASLDRLLSQPGYVDVRAVVVRADGHTVYERHPHSDSAAYHDVRSITRSVVATLIGIAADEGLLSLDATLAELLPRHADAMTPAVAGATLREVLTDTAGFPADGAHNSYAYLEPADPVAPFLAAADPVAAVIHDGDGPGDGSFAYSRAGAHVLSAVLEEATGTPVLDYARDRLFDPLGIDSAPAAEPVLGRGRAGTAYDGFAWPVDRTGLHLGYGTLRLRAGDLASLGQLHLDGGRWDGEQVVPEAWVVEATSRQVGTWDELDGFGFQWWVRELDGEPSYAAVGLGGQLVQVVPSRELVVVVATELRADDVASRGVDPTLMQYLVESAVDAVDGLPHD